jgi:DNA-binding response OmpR family regulator
VLAFDDWRLDTVSHRLFHHDGEEVILSGADFALLKLFLDHPQQILDRDTIGNATRGREPMPLDRIVDMAVSRLRQRLRDTDKPPRLIRTVRGSGYLLAAHVCSAP